MVAIETGRRGWGTARALLACLAVAGAAPGVAPARDGESAGVSLEGRTFIGNPRDVVVAGTLAYLALDTGLAIQDVSDPGDPVLVAQLYLPSPAHDVVVAGTLAYVANGESGLAIIDVADPAAPAVMGVHSADGVLGVAVAGSVAYLAQGADESAVVHGLELVDVSDPTTPGFLGFVPLPNGALDVAVAGSMAYVGVGSDLGLPSHGLALVDVSSPASPTLVGFADVGEAVNEVALEGSTALLAAGFPFAGALVGVDVSAPASPRIEWQVQLADAAMGLDVEGGLAHVAARSLGLLVFDLAGADGPELASSLPTGRETWAVAMAGDVAFLGERSSMGSAGFTTLLVPPPPDCPIELASAPFAEAMGAATDGGIALLLRRDGLSLVDGAIASTWTHPAADLSAVAVLNGLAAVAEADVVHLVDVADPGNPVERAQLVLADGVAVDLAFDGAILYVVDGLGLETFDVSDPSNPAALGTYRARAWASAVAVAAGRACLATTNALEVLDVSMPDSPTLEGRLLVPDQLYAVALDGDLAVVAGLATTVATVDVSSPASPVLLASLAGGPGFDVALAAGRAFVAAGASGVQVVDVSDPAQPVLDGWYDTSGTAVGIAVDGSTIHLATEDAQHWTLRCDACVAGCMASADVQPPSVAACTGTVTSFVGDTSRVTGCGSGELLYQWFEDGLPIPGATDPVLDIPATHAVGVFRITLEVTCSAAAWCASSADATLEVLGDTWPIVAPDSLRFNETAGREVMSWTIESGAGDTNIHASLLPWELSDSAITPATVTTTSPTDTWQNTLSAANGQVIFYKVFGRRSCSGASEVP